MSLKSLAVILALPPAVLFPQIQTQSPVPAFGPYNGSFIVSGLGLKKPLNSTEAPFSGNAVWSMTAWIRPAQALSGNTLLAGMGDLIHSGQRYFVAIDGHLAFWDGAGTVSTTAVLDPDKWTFVAATFDGTTLHLYSNAVEVAHQSLSVEPAVPVLFLAPLDTRFRQHFGGLIAHFILISSVLPQDALSNTLPEEKSLDLVEFEHGSPDWPVQTRAMVGLSVPQYAATLPKSKAPFTRPVSRPVALAGVLGAWKLAAAPDVHAPEAEISKPGFSTAGWLAATVPGTVLTTYIDRGIYPDPDYGLNNMAIPEWLNKRNYWYRTEFTPAEQLRGKRLTLTFEGINYSAAVWLNGNRIGTIEGAFRRGIFDVTGAIVPGRLNAIAVLISPPPHPGIAHEQSLSAGPGPNGGMECLDGPTFICTEGWDWIPGIRDRNTGMWQPVTLTASGLVQIEDPQVVTRVPVPDLTHAEVAVSVPLRNDSNTPVPATLQASFEGVNLTKALTLPPGQTTVNLTRAEFPQLVLTNPRLWWPNGYGAPDLYHLSLSVSTADGPSSSKSLQFGVREIEYDLSLVDRTGHLRRMEYSPSKANGVRVVDITHQGSIRTADGWVATLIDENSPAIHDVQNTRAAPYLVIKVNGVRIAAKGGNWGMDDSRKRVSREHLEPYFRLHRDAHMNIIRNWCGQSTEEVFYELADEYGLLVWNDFWDSTQNYNLEPTDSALFLDNVRETILRFRNHPSILLWCGRNEGVPSPTVNQGIDTLVRDLDGTRYYMASSNEINLQGSGPYRLSRPVDFFTTRARGFSVENGIPSMPTLEAFRAFVPEPDRWPISDTWAYHDWHQSGNGAVEPFMDALEEQFGVPRDLEDFERKAQMLNYVHHRAMYEGFSAHLWAPNSGRLMWMTHPSWPSTMWQLYSSDYDTQASFYGAQHGCEPVHVQLNLDTLRVGVIDNTQTPLADYSIRARIFSLDGKVLWTHTEKTGALRDSATERFVLEPLTHLRKAVVFVDLELMDAANAVVSRNFYWYADQDSDYRALNTMPPAPITANALAKRDGTTLRITIALQASAVALMTKLTLLHTTDRIRVLPAYWSDNYISLLPGESRTVTVECPRTVAGPLEIGIRGWNVTERTIVVRE